MKVTDLKKVKMFRRDYAEEIIEMRENGGSV